MCKTNIIVHATTYTFFFIFIHISLNVSFFFPLYTNNNYCYTTANLPFNLDNISNRVDLKKVIYNKVVFKKKYRVPYALLLLYYIREICIYNFFFFLENLHDTASDCQTVIVYDIFICLRVIFRFRVFYQIALRRNKYCFPYKIFERSITVRVCLISFYKLSLI